MADVNTLKFPAKSHRKEILYPGLSRDFAEFVGIMLGDGGINNDWQATITVNSIADREYAVYIARLCKRLFGITPAMRERKTRNAMVISIASTSLVDFLVSSGIPRGNKLRHGLSVPSWIRSRDAFKTAFVRGLVDTDGCVFVHRHRVGGREYQNIGLTFTSYDKKFLFEVASILADFGIMPHITKRGKDIYLYQADAVAKYLKVFGTSNKRISSVYQKWQQSRSKKF